MMKKRIGTMLLALAVALTTLSVSAFAITADDLQNGPNSMAMITIENEDCLQIEKVQDLSVKISKEGTSIEIPVKNVELDGELVNMWLGYGTERISNEIMAELVALQGPINMLAYKENPEKLAEDIGDVLEDWEVEILGLPEGHYTYSGGAIVLTQEIFQQIVELVKEIFGEEFGEFTTFKELIEKILADAELSLEDLDPETRAELEDLINNIDPIIAYLTSAEFSGFLIYGAELACDCPFLYEYQIMHRYYQRVDGKLKLVGTVNEGEYDSEYEEYYLVGEEGDLIGAKDFLKRSYNGVSYEFVGSYDMDVLYKDQDESLKDYKLESFRLGDDWTEGLVLRYVIDEEPLADVEQQGNGEKSPDTGDQSPITACIVLLVTAVLAAGAVAAYNKK